MIAWLQATVDGAFVLLFIASLINLGRRLDTPRATVAAFFGSLVAGVAIGVLDDVPTPAGAAATRVALAAVLAAPWLFVVLAGGFRVSSPWGPRLAFAGFVFAELASFARIGPWAGLVVIAYFVGSFLYGALVLARAARGSAGVTLRRLQWLGVAGVVLALTVVVEVVVGWSAPDALDSEAILVLELALGVCLFVALATPRFLRRAWQAIDVARFLREARDASPDTRAQRTVERVPFAARDALGASWAGVALREGDVYVFRSATSAPPSASFKGGALAASLVADRTVRIVTSADEGGGWLRGVGAGAAAVAPLVARGNVVGFLNVFFPRAPLFEEDARATLGLLAQETSLALEQSQLVDELQRAVARSERLSVLGTLVASVAHETNNLLTYSRGFVELAALDADGDARRELDSALRGLDSIVRLARSLKAAAREGGGVHEPVDVNALVTSVRDLIATAAPPSVTLDAELVEPAPIAFASGPQVHQVVLNLAKNAIEALGTCEGRVVIRTRVVDDRVEVAVEDDGPGVPPEVATHLFEPFVTTKTAGTGLGLSISRKIARENGGDLVLDPPHGRGATFRLRLPLPA